MFSSKRGLTQRGVTQRGTPARGQVLNCRIDVSAETLTVGTKDLTPGHCNPGFACALPDAGAVTLVQCFGRTPLNQGYGRRGIGVL